MKIENQVKTTKKIIAGIGLATVVGLVIYMVRRSKTRRMLDEVANEGYETAYDILFPEKKRKDRKSQYAR